MLINPDVLGHSLSIVWYQSFLAKHHQGIRIRINHCTAPYSVSVTFVHRIKLIIQSPIYITAAVLAVVTAYLADRSSQRSPFVFIPMCAILGGYIIAISGAAHGGLPGLVYAGVFISASGVYAAFPGQIAWISSNLAGSYKRAAGMAIQIGVGNLGGAMASNFYRANDSPKYILGHALEIAFICVGLVAVIVLRVNYKRINKKRDTMGVDENLGNKEMSEMGDRAPTFRYVV